MTTTLSWKLVETSTSLETDLFTFDLVDGISESVKTKIVNCLNLLVKAGINYIPGLDQIETFMKYIEFFI